MTARQLAMQKELLSHLKNDPAINEHGQPRKVVEHVQEIVDAEELLVDSQRFVR